MLKNRKTWDKSEHDGERPGPSLSAEDPIVRAKKKPLKRSWLAYAFLANNGKCFAHGKGSMIVVVSGDMDRDGTG